MANDNPALQLHRILTAWKITPNGKRVIDFRGGNSGWVEAHLRAIKLVAAVQAHMESIAIVNDNDLEQSEAARARFVRALIKGIFVVDSPMAAAQGDRDHFDQTVLDHLHMIGSTWKLVQPEPAAVSTILEAAVEAQKLVLSAPDLGDEARHYLHELAAHLVKAAGDVDAFGATHLRSLAAELSGSLAVYFSEAAQTEREVADGLVQRLLRGAKDLFLGQVLPRVIEAGVDQTIRMLPPGP